MFENQKKFAAHNNMFENQKKFTAQNNEVKY